MEKPSSPNATEYIIMSEYSKNQTTNSDHLDVDDFSSENEEGDECFTEKKKVNSEQEKEFTSKFLSGEMTFSEYAARMGGTEGDEIEDNIAGNTECCSKYIPSKEPDKSQHNQQEDKKKSSKRKVKIKRTLPPALKGLMGEANLRYARGDHDTAMKMCLEIIRQVPTAPEPFQTLSSLYDELGDAEKSLQMSLIAAHLSPSDSYQWINLGVMSEDQGNIKQAITCYSKAISADISNIDIHFKRAALLEQIGDKKLALKGYSRLLSVMDPQQGEVIMNLAKMLAEKYHDENDLSKAKETLEIAFVKCPKLITTEFVNIMLEVLLGLKDYTRCLEIMVAFCELEIEAQTDGEGHFLILSCIVPDSMAVDIRAKFIVCLIHLKAFHILDELLTNFMSLNPEDAGDLFLDVGEALMAEGKHEKALQLLNPLIQSQKYNLPAVCLRIAECYKVLGCLEESVSAYLSVVDKAPHHLDARLTVSELLNRLGRKDEAVAILTQDESEILDPALLYERCQLLKDNPEQVDQFLAVGQLLLSRHCIPIRSRDDLQALVTSQRSEKKLSALKEIRSTRGDPQVEEDRPDFYENSHGPSVEEEWDLFWNMCEILLKSKQYELLERICFSAQGSQLFIKYSNQIHLLCFISCFHNSDAYYGYNLARAIVLKNTRCVRAWNLFNLMLLRADDSRHNRFLMRLLTRNPNHSVLSNLHANNCLVAGTYKYALSEYSASYQKKNSPMIAFLLGITLCQMACQKFSAKKHSLVAQAIAYFWKYRELRGPDGLQEFHYNMGRTFHQLGLLPQAIFHYKQALDVKSDFLKQNEGLLDLKREAAFNLHLIYLVSGAREIARMYLEKYVVV